MAAALQSQRRDVRLAYRPGRCRAGCDHHSAADSILCITSCRRIRHTTQRSSRCLFHSMQVNQTILHWEQHKLDEYEGALVIKLKAQTKRSLPKRLLPICRNTVPTALSSASSSSVNPTAPRQGKRHCYARHKRNICVGSITLDKSPFGSGRCGRRVGKRNEKPSIKPTSAYPERSHQRRCESLTWP